MKSMKSKGFQSLVSSVLVATSLLTWAVPSYALREEQTVDSGLEERQLASALLTGIPEEDLSRVSQAVQKAITPLFGPTFSGLEEVKLDDLRDQGVRLRIARNRIHRLLDAEIAGNVLASRMPLTPEKYQALMAEVTRQVRTQRGGLEPDAPSPELKAVVTEAIALADIASLRKEFGPRLVRSTFESGLEEDARGIEALVGALKELARQHGTLVLSAAGVTDEGGRQKFSVKSRALHHLQEFLQRGGMALTIQVKTDDDAGWQALSQLFTPDGLRDNDPAPYPPTNRVRRFQNTSLAPLKWKLGDILSGPDFVASWNLVITSTTSLPTPGLRQAGLEEGKAVVVGPVEEGQRKALAQWADHFVGRAFDESRAFEVPQLSDPKANNPIPDFLKRWAQERQQRELEPVLPEEQKAAGVDLRASLALVQEAVNLIGDPTVTKRLEEETRFVFVLEPALPNIEETSFAAQVMGFPPKVHHYYGLASPALYEEGDPNSDTHKAVVAVAGTFPYEVYGQPAASPRTIYLSVARLKRYAQLANAAGQSLPDVTSAIIRAVQSQFIHLDADLVAGEHQPWATTDEMQHAEKRINELWEMDVKAERQKWALRDAKRVTETFVSVNLRNVFGDFSEIPPAVAQAAEAVLEKAKRERVIKDSVVLRVGDYLLFDVSHPKRAQDEVEEDESVGRLIASAVFKAIGAGAKLNLAFSAAWQATRSRSDTSAFELLDWHNADWRYTERASQPTLRQVIVGGSPKSSDGVLFDLYASPNITTQQAIEGSHGTYAVVQNVDQPSMGLGITLPGGVTNKGLFDFLAVGKTSDHATRAIFPGKGSRFPLDEPLAVAIPLGDLQVVVYNSQAGAEAVGGITGPATAPRIVDGKERRLSLKPVTLEQAPYLTRAKLQGELAGFAPTVIWGTQMFGNGEFDQIVDPIEGPEFSSTQLNDIREEFARILLGQGEAQPFLKTEAANRRALDAFKRFSARAEKRPKEIEEGTLTTGVFKADIGSALGHTEPPKVFMAVTRAVLEEAKQAGLIQDYLVKRRRHTVDQVSEFRVGDDIELHITHTRPVGDPKIHGLAWRAFWAAGWVLSDVLARKPYGLMQDLPNAKDLDAWVEGAMTKETLHFIAQNLRRVAQEDPRAIDEDEIDKVLINFNREYEAQRAGTRQPKAAADKAKFQFTGNVKGSGIGSAEGYITPGAWSILAFDKASPGAFSVPFMKAAEAALAAGVYTTLLFEVEKVRPEYDANGKEIPQSPIILDFANLDDRQLIKAMLGAVNEFQIKAIRTRDQEGTMRLVAVNSTDRLYQVTAGVYAGKDDPVSFMDSRFGSFVFQWMQRELFITEGDERGSHWAFVLPVPMDRSSPGTHSIPIAVGLNFTVTEQGEVRGVEDVFDSPSYDPIRSKAAYYNWAFIRSIGNFGPRGDAASVEATYPLWQNLARITAPNSPYALSLAAGLEEVIRFESAGNDMGVHGFLLEEGGLAFGRVFAIAAAQGHWWIPFAGIAPQGDIDRLVEGLPFQAAEILRERLVAVDGVGIDAARGEAEQSLKDQVPDRVRASLVITRVTEAWDDLVTQLLGYLRFVGLRFATPQDEERALALVRAA